MSVPPDLLVLARHARAIRYDRATIDAAVAAHQSGWQLSQARVKVVTRTTRATLDVIESLPGTTLDQRWAAFEAEVWPRWHAGDRHPLRRKEGWSLGVRTLILARLVQPAWSVVSGFKMSEWARILPATDPIRQARATLERASESCVVGTPVMQAAAVDTATKLILVRGVDRIDSLTAQDLLVPPAGTKACDILDALLCQLGVLPRTPSQGTSRRRTVPRRTERELVKISGVPEPFAETVAVYLETYARRLSDVYATLRHKSRALAHFFTYIATEHPEVTSCAEVTPAHARGFIPYALELARTVQRASDRKGTNDRTTAYAWMINVRTFFADLSTWAAEPGSPLAGHAPSMVILARHDLLDAGYVKARKRQRAQVTETVLEVCGSHRTVAKEGRISRRRRRGQCPSTGNTRRSTATRR